MPSAVAVSAIDFSDFSSSGGKSLMFPSCGTGSQQSTLVIFRVPGVKFIVIQSNLRRFSLRRIGIYGGREGVAYRARVYIGQSKTRC